MSDNKNTAMNNENNDENNSSDEFPYRYTAKIANQIEKKWQEKWQELGTFYASNPKGDLVDRNNQNSCSGDNKSKEPFFILDMFPYPSGAGLHVGHPLGYIATDVIGRYQRMNNKNVLHALGFDAFGLPAEQYAIQTGKHPKDITRKNIASMKRQTSQIGLAHDERRSFATIDSDYVKWTQWIFLQIYNAYYDEEYVKPNGKVGSARPISELIEKYKSGEKPIPSHESSNWDDLSEKEKDEVLKLSRLAYTKSSPVNWAPGLGTVLANEEVTNEGKSERGNFPVFQKTLEQWFMRITKYSQRLLDGLDELNWPDQVKAMQKHWIGKSTGLLIDFAIQDKENKNYKPLKVFTTRPDTLFGASFLAVAPEHPFINEIKNELSAEAIEYINQAKAKKSVDRMIHSNEKTGVFTNYYAINPVNDKPIPIFIADYVLIDYGTGAIMAVPGGDQRDYDFAKKFDLPIIFTVVPEGSSETELLEKDEAYAGDGKIVNSCSDKLDLNGLSIQEGKEKITKWFESNKLGELQINYKLRDWLFSRQRYWGEPFPIVYDEDGVTHQISESMLPIKLPDVPDYTPKTYDPNDENTEPETPLSKNTDWVNVELDLGDGLKKYRRETNTMPNWAGSSWYYLRYIDPANTDFFVDPENEKYWMSPNHNKTNNAAGGVDLYVGGKEHTVLHLLYARFWHMVLYDLGFVSSPEPFNHLFNQGYIQAYAYTNSVGTYVPADEIEEKQVKEGSKTTTEYYYKGEKVNREYGKMGKSLKNVVTPDEIYNEYGADTFRIYEMSMGPLDISKPWETRSIIGSMRFLQKFCRNIIDEKTGEVIVSTTLSEEDLPLETKKIINRTIEDVKTEIEAIRPNTAIAKLITLNNHLTGLDELPKSVAEKFILMISPFAPHIAEELWSKLGHSDSLAFEDFPKADKKYLVEDEITAIVQINGKLKGKLQVAKNISKDELEKTALEDEKVKNAIDDFIATQGGEIRKIITKEPKLVSIVIR